MAMALRHALPLLLVLVPLAVAATFTVEPARDIIEWGPDSDDDSIDGLVSHVPLGFIGSELSVCLPGACDTSDIRRGLASHRRYISYDALKKNRVPCNRRGRSYYNCRQGRQANPYRRGCSMITRCGRILN